MQATWLVAQAEVLTVCLSPAGLLVLAVAAVTMRRGAWKEHGKWQAEASCLGLMTDVPLQALQKLLLAAYSPGRHSPSAQGLAAADVLAAGVPCKLA